MAGDLRYSCAEEPCSVNYWAPSSERVQHKTRRCSVAYHTCRANWLTICQWAGTVRGSAAATAAILLLTDGQLQGSAS